MARLAGRAAKLGARSRSGAARLFTALLFIATAISFANAAAATESDLKRAVLGTIVAPGVLEIESGPETWTPATQGVPVLEDTQLRTGSGKKAVIALGKQGVIGLSEESALHIGSVGTDGLPVSLRGEGELSFRLPTNTALTFLTDSAIVKGPQPMHATAGEAWIQGTIAQRENETIVNVLEGSLQIRNRNANEFVTLGSGEQATIAGPVGTPRIARMTDAPEPTSQRRLAAMFGTKTGLIAGATAVAIGGGLGGAAAAGAFDDGEQAAQGSGNEPAASPFRP